MRNLKNKVGRKGPIYEHNLFLFNLLQSIHVRWIFFSNAKYESRFRHHTGTPTLSDVCTCTHRYILTSKQNATFLKSSKTLKYEQRKCDILEIIGSTLVFPMIPNMSFLLLISIHSTSLAFTCETALHVAATVMITSCIGFVFVTVYCTNVDLIHAPLNMHVLTSFTSQQKPEQNYTKAK